MIVSLVAIGNSKGIRIPKAVLDHLEIEDSLSLEIENGSIILNPITKNPRQGWEEAFQKMNNKKEDRLLLALNEEAGFEWEW